MGVALKSNTTLIELNLDCDDIFGKHQNVNPINNSPLIFTISGNMIGPHGGKSLCKSFEVNTTLEKLILSRQHDENNEKPKEIFC